MTNDGSTSDDPKPKSADDIDQDDPKKVEKLSKLGHDEDHEESEE